MTPNKFEIPIIVILSLVLGLTILLLSCGNSIQAAAQVMTPTISSSPILISSIAEKEIPDPKPISTPIIAANLDTSIKPAAQNLEFAAGVDIEDAVLLYDSNRPDSFDINFCEIAQFYGVLCKMIALDTTDLTDAQLRDQNGNYFELIGISARNFLSQPSLLSDAELQIIRSMVNTAGAVLFVSNTDPSMDISTLTKLTEGTIIGVNHVNSPIMGWNISNKPEITQQFAGQFINYFSTDSLGYFAIEHVNSPQVTNIINSKNMDGTEYPIFIQWQDGSGSVFIDSTPSGVNLLDLPFSQMYNNPKFFPELMPLMFTFRYALGNETWHSSQNLANLTIDDPILTSTFYELSFSQLLQQMEEHNFHTTIAYRPGLWQQFDIGTVKLIEENPARYSLVQHGNNHDGYEFYKYTLRTNDPKNNPDLRARPLSEQEDDIINGLKRLNEIQNSLNLTIDPVMIFPYGISPEQTLVLLKKYNYLASVSQQEIPLDATAPTTWDFGMYPAETYYGNFASVLRRHPGSYLPFKADFQPFLFDLFLGKPALFYSHAREEIFADGIDGFNPAADWVNNIRKPVEWRSLGYILTHLYQEKTDDDGSISIRMYIRNLVLANDSTNTQTYHIFKNEILNVPSISITVDGKQYPYHVQDGMLRLNLQIPPKESVEINITYQ